MTYTIRVFDIVDGERKPLVEAKAEDRAAADCVFNRLGPCFDVVQLWSKDENGNPVYRQF